MLSIKFKSHLEKIKFQLVKVGSYYKYYYGNASEYKEVLKALKIAKEKGYSSAFIVAFKSGKKISVKEANKMQ